MRKSFVILICLFLLYSCNDAPSYVIAEDDMVSLLVDVHKGEAVTEIDGGHYYNDSLKKMLKQSVFIKHGITQEQFDTSLVWYAHNMDKYIEVYDKVIKTLEEEDKAIVAEAKASGRATPMAAGDSVNLWTKEDIRIFSSNKGYGELTFDILADANFKKGDNYQIAFRLLNNQKELNLFLGVDYRDGSTSYITKVADAEGWTKLSLQTDSARIPRRVYGYVDRQMLNAKEVIFLDSISFVRKRLNKDNYSPYHMQKMLERKKK